ncbi:nuclear transport factor 2 family protein [Nocardia sp. NPDC003345]
MTNDNSTLRNKELVQHVYSEFTAGNIEVLRTALHEDFLEHSPGNPSGRDAFIDYIGTAPVAASRLELARVIAEGEYVVVHYRMIPPDGDPDLAVVDIWRLADGKIVEHWDTLQQIPDAAQIPHGMF